MQADPTDREGVAAFYAALTTLWARMDGGLLHLALHDTRDALLYEEAPELCQALAQHLPQLRSFEVGGEVEAPFPFPPHAFLLCTMGCTRVQRFRDAHPGGLELRSLSAMVDGWRELQHLALVTEVHRVRSLFRALRHFGGRRLRCLEVTAFLEPLTQPKAWATFKEGVHHLRLQELVMDHQLSPHADGLDAGRWAELLDACPTLTHIAYSVGMESFDGHQDMQQLDATTAVKTKARADSGIAAVEYAGYWATGDGRGLRERTTPPLPESALADGQVGPFLRTLEGVARLCGERGVTCHLTWTI